MQTPAYTHLPFGLSQEALKSHCLLFIFDEMIRSFTLIEQLKRSTFEKLQAPPLFKQLMDFYFEIEPFILGNLKAKISSPLDKLLFYSDQLINATETKIDGVLPILEEMKAASFSLKAQFTKWKYESFSKEKVLKELFKFYCFTVEKFRSFFHMLFPAIEEMKENENLLMFLIEKKESFNQFIGDRSVERLLSSLFPGGIHDLKELIFQGYAKRGFSHIFEEQKHLIEKLEWDAACPTFEKAR